MTHLCIEDALMDLGWMSDESLEVEAKLGVKI
jgi:hypothetical protein